MSFFGGKNDKKTPHGGEAKSKNVSGTVMETTGGVIDNVVEALVKNANDSKSTVRESMSSALVDIGRHQPDLVLSCCYQYLRSHSGSTDHRVVLLKVMCRVLEVTLDDIGHDLGVGLIEQSLAEMTEDREVVPEWQTAASEALVLLGRRWPSELLNRLIDMLTPGSVPHYFVLKTLGDFAGSSPMELVPRLREILSRSIPVFGSVNRDNMRWVFAAGMGHFCDAVIQYMANMDTASDKTLTLDSFSAEVFQAYEILFNNWLKSGKSQVRLATVQAIGHMSSIMLREEFETNLPAMLQGVLGLYRKEKSHLPITIGVTGILKTATRDNDTAALEPLLPSVLNTLHPMACATGNPDDPNSLRNSNELLRCFEILAAAFIDEVASFLLGPKGLASKDANVRAGTLNIIRHLVNRLEDQIDDRKSMFVSGVKPLLSAESSVKVRKSIAQLMIAMASHEYLSLEGGDSLIEFVIRQCALSDAEIKAYDDKLKGKTNADTMASLRAMSQSILNLSTTTVQDIDTVMWPYLLEFIVPQQYTAALPFVCKGLAVVAAAKRERDDEDYYIDFDRLVNLPKPQAIIMRLLVVLNNPFNAKGSLIGKEVLATLRSIGPILHPSICDMWDSALPKLGMFLDKNADDDTFKQTQWEDLVMRLLAETIKLANDDEWTIGLAEALSNQLDFYKTLPELKRVALKHMGLILQKITKKEFIRNRLETMFMGVDHTNEQERQGCAQGFGFCAATHLDIALEKITDYSKRGQGSGGFFSFLSSADKEKQMPPGSTATLALCMGYVAAYAPANLITSRLEVHLLAHLVPLMKAAKSNEVKEASIKAIDLIGKTVHPSHLHSDEFTFKRRDDLITLLLNYMAPVKESGNISHQVRILSLNAVSTLIFLDPPLPHELEADLVERASNAYFKLRIESVKKRRKGSKAPKPGSKEATETSKEAAALKLMGENFVEMLGALLYMDSTTSTLQRIFSVLEAWITSTKSTVSRECGVASFLAVLMKFIEYKESETGEKVETFYEDVGHVLATFVPRCTDPHAPVRRQALRVLENLLYADSILQQSADLPSEDGYNLDRSEKLLSAADLTEQISSTELNVQFGVVHQMAGVLAGMVSEVELPKMILSLLHGLVDPEVSASSGTCVVLNGLVRLRGEELLPKVPELLQGILTTMESIKEEKTMNGTLHSLRSLATHHLVPVLGVLLAESIPQSEHVRKSLHIIAKDAGLADPTFTHLMDIMNTSLVLEPKPGSKTPEASAQSMAATVSLGCILEVEEVEGLVMDRYPELLVTVLLRFGTTEKLKDSTARKQAVATMRTFLECAKDEEIEQALTEDGGWSTLEGKEYYHAITTIARTVAEAHPDDLQEIHDRLQPYLRGNFPGQRVVTATIYAEFVKHIEENQELLRGLVNCFLASLADETIKLQVLIGLGNVSSAGTDMLSHFGSTIIDALMCSIDASDEELAMEAINGLSKVFEVVDDSRVSPILVNLCHRIRPSFENKSDTLRAASFRLFGTLSRFGNGSAASVFYEQIHHNLPSLVLHLKDESDAVQLACKKSLRRLAPLLCADDITELFESKAFDEGYSLVFPDFLESLSKKLIAHFPERMNFYVMTCVGMFKSEWDVLRESAVLFVGSLLGNLPVELRSSSNLNPGLVTAELIALLKAKNSDIRIAVCNTMAVMHTY
eukprot:TRINITY_DN1880_c0_g3_i1.p1 TRINITY_DN1880_c0_g3~~TRINITY_DN1880_c0_g3_i1.p1  ORF type:complete len:1673 (+),score=516.54 TRINITY_DN1880_c0_g3_i1:168-5186(+)